MRDLVNENKNKMWLSVASKFICKETIFPLDVSDLAVSSGDNGSNLGTYGFIQQRLQVSLSSGPSMPLTEFLKTPVSR